MLPVAERRREAIGGYLDVAAPDVLVLTETHDSLDSGLPYVHSSAEGRDGYERHRDGHRWVSISSRYPMEPLVVRDERRSVAARVCPGRDDPFIAFGTVLPWLGSPWREYESAGGVAFREALSVQEADWMALRSAYPDDEFFLMGDFNQDLVTPSYYGSRANRDALEAALAAAGLVALTAGAGDPIRRDLTTYACIDHICARADSKWDVEATSKWPQTNAPLRWMSDHFGVGVELSRR